MKARWVRHAYPPRKMAIGWVTAKSVASATKTPMTTTPKPGNSNLAEAASLTLTISLPCREDMSQKEGDSHPSKRNRKKSESGMPISPQAAEPIERFFNKLTSARTHCRPIGAARSYFLAALHLVSAIIPNR